MESRSARDYMAFGAVLLVARCDTRYLRVLHQADDRRLCLAGCTVGIRFASTLGERDLPAPTLGRCMGVPT